MTQMIEQQFLNTLEQIKNACNMIDAKESATAKHFNVFKILDVTYDEVRLCRILYELLDPRGKHAQGDAFLRLFLNQVLGIVDITEEEYKTLRVHREYVMAADRRIDLAIQTSKRFIPIEVKVYAQDQRDQCADYISFARNNGLNKNDNWQLYYLTRFGEAPSAYSINSNLTRIKNISWLHDIIPWLMTCEGLVYQKGLQSISSIISQFIDSINFFTETVEDEKMQAMSEILTKDSDTFRSALLLESAMTEIKTQWLMKLFQMLTTTMEEKGHPRSKSTALYDFDGPKGSNFYDNRNTTYPGVCFKYENRQHIDSSYEIYARLEIWQNSVGVGYFVIKEGAGAVLDITNQLPHPFDIEKKITRWWSSWKYVTLNGGASPDFKNPAENEPYIKWVTDEIYRQQFVNQCVVDLISLLEAKLT